MKYKDAALEYMEEGYYICPYCGTTNVHAFQIREGADGLLEKDIVCGEDLSHKVTFKFYISNVEAKIDDQ